LNKLNESGISSCCHCSLLLPVYQDAAAAAA